MINLLRSLVVLAVVLAVPLAAQADVFLRVLAPGATTGGNQQAVTLKVTAAPIVLRVDAKTEGMTGADLTGASVQYFLDEQPLSSVVTGPATGTAQFAWTWTPPAGFKGVHVLQAKVVTGGPVGAVYKSFGTMVFGAVHTGAQRLPALSPFTTAGTSLSASAEKPEVAWFQYPGTPPVLPSLPLRGILAPYPPANPQALISAAGWVVEPLTNAGHGYSAAVPSLCYENGQPWVCKHYQQAGNLSFVAAESVVADLHTDGPRGTNVVSPYNTCVPTPERPGYGTCVDLSGRVTNIGPTGYVHTIVGPWQACDTCPVEWRGDFAGGLRFNTPNDINYDFVDKTILYVADTGNHRIARIDLKTTPPKITTLAGGAGRGYLDGPGLTAKFNEVYSVISHGPHPCPGRPEFNDCIHLYAGDMRNGAIRLLDLHRQGEIPVVSTIIGGPTKLPPVDAAYATPANYVQTCDQAACSVNWPMVVRWDSNFNLIIGETTTGAIRRYNWSTKQLELITIRPGGKRTEFPGWLWLDVDRRGEVGPKDDILWGTSVTSSGDLFRISADGTRISQMDGSGNLQEGQGRYVPDFPGHYAWMISIIWGKLWLSGYGSVGIREARPFTAADHQTALNTTYYNSGRTIMGDHAEVSALYGGKGWNRLGLKTWDEQANLADADLKTWLRSLIPTLTDDQVLRAMYYIRWNSLRAMAEPILVGQVMGPGTPLPPQPPPQYTVTIATVGQGTTSGAGTFPSGATPTLEATPVTQWQFAGWSVCSTATTPKITLPPLTANTACTATFTAVPLPPTVDSFTGAPLSVQLGQPAVLTWETSNATAVTINGVAVPVDGTQTVTPTTTTHYDLLANGISRRVTITVTVPPPPEDREVTVEGKKYKIIEVTP